MALATSNLISYPPYLFRPSPATFQDTRVEIDRTHRPNISAIDNIEREYRARCQPQYKEETNTRITVDQAEHKHHHHHHHHQHKRPVFRQDVHIEETVEIPRTRKSNNNNNNNTTTTTKMGYYEDGKLISILFSFILSLYPIALPSNTVPSLLPQTTTTATPSVISSTR